MEPNDTINIFGAKIEYQYITPILVVMVLVVLFYNVFMIQNAQNSSTNISSTEPYVSLYRNVKYCNNCNEMGKNDCSECIDCGYCYDENGAGECVPGDINGPYFREDCYNYEYRNPMYYDNGLTYTYLHDHWNSNRHNSRYCGRHPCRHRGRHRGRHWGKYHNKQYNTKLNNSGPNKPSPVRNRDTYTPLPSSPGYKPVQTQNSASRTNFRTRNRSMGGSMGGSIGSTRSSGTNIVLGNYKKY